MASGSNKHASGSVGQTDDGVNQIAAECDAIETTSDFIPGRRRVVTLTDPSTRIGLSYENTSRLTGLALERSLSSVKAHTKGQDQNTFEGMTGFASRFRTLDIEIVNNTDTFLNLIDEKFLSGSWYIHPKLVNIPPGGICLAYVASRVRSPIGVKGVIVYEFVRKNKFLYVGFENPAIGRYKIYIEINSTRFSAKDICSKIKTDAVINTFFDDFHIMAEIKSPKMSKFRLFRYTVEDKLAKQFKDQLMCSSN